MSFCRLLSVLVAVFLAAGEARSAEDPAVSFHLGESVRFFQPTKVRNWRGARTEGLLIRLWYPVDPAISELPHDIGPPGHPLFKGASAAPDAPLFPGDIKFPLILLSHGTGGSADSLDWLGAFLARAGYVVAGVNHPGNNALEPLTADGFRLWWERALDLSDVLDAVLADPIVGPRIARDRIGAAGFSLGGYTVLELAGARTDRLAFEAFCASKAADAICRPPEMNALGKLPVASSKNRPETAQSLARSGDSFRDARVGAVFAIAPALGEAFDAAGMAGVAVPVALAGGTADTTVPVATNIQRIAGLLPAATVTMVPGAGHYTFLDSCLPGAPLELAWICKDGPEVDRDAVHRRLAGQVERFFTETLPARR